MPTTVAHVADAFVASHVRAGMPPTPPSFGPVAASNHRRRYRSFVDVAASAATSMLAAAGCAVVQLTKVPVAPSVDCL